MQHLNSNCTCKLTSSGNELSLYLLIVSILLVMSGIACRQYIIHNKYCAEVYLVPQDAKLPSWTECYEDDGFSEANETIPPVLYKFIRENCVWKNKDNCEFYPEYVITETCMYKE